MPFASTITHNSETLPGVSFTLRRLGLGKRTDIAFATLKFQQRMRELEADYPPYSDKEKELSEQLSIARRQVEEVSADQKGAALLVAAEITAELEAACPPGVKGPRDVIDEEYRIVDARIRVEWIRAGLIQIKDSREGIAPEDCLDEMTVDQLLEYGPPSLAQEIYAALAGDGQLRGAASKNSASPTTSGAVVGGESRNLTAPPVAVVPVAGT